MIVRGHQGKEMILLVQNEWSPAGTWGVTFNPAQPWGKEIVRLRTESNGPKTSLYTFSASKQQLPGRQVACSVPRVISDWSTARSGGFVVNGFLRLIIEAKDE